MHRILVLTHSNSLIPGFATSLGWVVPLECEDGPAEDWDCWARQEGSSPLVPAIRYTYQPAAWRPAQSCPVVRAAVITRGRGQSQSRTHPAAWSHCFWPPPLPPHYAAQAVGPERAELCASQVYRWSCMARREANRPCSQRAFGLKSTSTPIRQMHRCD